MTKYNIFRIKTAFCKDLRPSEMLSDGLYLTFAVLLTA